RRELRVVTVDAESPSPFAASLLFGYVANYIYDGDAPLAERRAQALAVDHAQLRELLGAAELREPPDGQVLRARGLALKGRTPGHTARWPARLHDLRLRIGDLSLAEIEARAEVALPPRPPLPAAGEGESASTPRVLSPLPRTGRGAG